MGVSLPDSSFLEGAPQQSCTPELSFRISSALLLVLLGEGPALLPLQLSLPKSVFGGVGSVCASPTADPEPESLCWAMLLHHLHCVFFHAPIPEYGTLCGG